MDLRPYQIDLRDRIYAEWHQGARAVCAVSPTGSGKTVLVSHIVRNVAAPTRVIAHRQEIVSQLSLSLAREGVRHRIIAPRSVVQGIIRLQSEVLGRVLYSASAATAVVGVDTLIARGDDRAHEVGLVVVDECHHLLSENKWGKAVQMYPLSARILGVTANTNRADGAGLGRHADGVIDSLVIGTSMRELIKMGALSDYRVYSVPSDLSTEGLRIGSTGDYAAKDLRQRARKSHIVGDVVATYQRICPGKIGITFATDVETAGEIAAQYVSAGVPAIALSAQTTDMLRRDALRKLARGDLKMVINVDLIGEGFDAPAVEVVAMARPTASHNLYCQMIGRGLRPSPGKTHAIILDHVGNVIRHRLPDAYTAWTLDRRERSGRGKRDPDLLPVRACPGCTAIYESVSPICPYCGHKPQPAGRSKPEQVDGDLIELDAAALAALRGEIERVDAQPTAVRDRMLRAGAPRAAALGAEKQHRLRQEAQGVLREAIALWAGYQRAAGRSDSESYRRFFHTFGLDVLSAQALSRPDAEKLAAEITDVIKLLSR